MSILNDILMHVGVSAKDGAPGRGSGRYPLGSGEKPYQHGSASLLSRYNELKKSGYSDPEIAGILGVLDKYGKPSSGKLRTQIMVARHDVRAAKVAEAKRLREAGYSLPKIAEIMGYENESSVRSLLNEHSKERMSQAQTTADFLKEVVSSKGMIDVSKGTELELGVSKEKLKEALYILELEGYPCYDVGVPQATIKGQQTITKVLAPPGTEYKEAYSFENISSIKDYDEKILIDDGTKITKAFKYPESMDSSRLMIRYAEDGGKDKDGVIEIRRGVQDLSLGEAHYAQVRILVDGTHYLKGMAVYSDDMPDGVDVIFNTNKNAGTPALGLKNNTVLKNITKDPDNPFGSLIKEKGGQSTYIDADGNEKLSLINKRAEEGDWNEWSDKLPSQFLAKQSMSLINRQLNMSIQDKVDEFNDICAYTNPTIKKQLLASFADDCDASAVHLKAAALPRQKYKVILPLTTIKDTEVYAPSFEDGEKVALIRFPHGGTFEIPILTVNNKLKEGKRVLGKQPKDAIGINSKVAERLSGADFDGDTVMIIPTNDKIKITSQPPLKGLEGFDPKLEYGGKPEGTFKIMKNTQNEMGRISNLITDMTLKGANTEELARAVRHSMVVIDAEKHHLDYKQSEKDNNIAALRRKYQGRIDEDGKYREGASTLISRASAQKSVPKRQGSPIVNDDGSISYKTSNKLYYEDKKKVKAKDSNGKNVKDSDGNFVYETDSETGKVKYESTGKIKMRTQQSTQMAETKDAFSLVSDYDTPQERAYATYANKMKSLANQARKEIKSTGKIEYDSNARKTYQEEVDVLNSKLNEAKLNAPKERAAQRIANSRVKAKRAAYEEAGLTSSEIRAELDKEAQRALTSARAQVGAERKTINITDREWEAIQSGAISETVLTEILKYTDIDEIKQRAMPRTVNELSDSKIVKIKNMSNMDYTTSQIAQAVGVSTSTVLKYL